MEGELVYLRAVEPQDTDLLYQWENDPSLWSVSNTLVPFSRFQLEQYVLQAQLDIYAARQLRLMIIRKGVPDRPVGTVDLFDFDPLHQRAGLGIMILKDDRQQGLASEALSLMIQYGFSVLQLHQIYCHIGSGNQPSIDLFRKHGFDIRGTRKEWTRENQIWKDELFLQLINPY